MKPAPHALHLAALASAAVCLLVLGDLWTYILGNDSNHTGFEPWLLLVVFLPAIVIGGLAIRERAVAAGTFAILIALGGLAVLAYIDATNTMVQYDRWLQRGMPPGPR